MGDARRRFLASHAAGAAIAAAADPPIATDHGGDRPVEIAGQVEGRCVLVLADGTSLVGLLTASKVVRAPGRDPKTGRPVYNIDWQVGTAFLVDGKGT